MIKHILNKNNQLRDKYNVPMPRIGNGERAVPRCRP